MLKATHVVYEILFICSIKICNNLFLDWLSVLYTRNKHNFNEWMIPVWYLNHSKPLYCSAYARCLRNQDQTYAQALNHKLFYLLQYTFFTLTSTPIPSIPIPDSEDSEALVMRGPQARVCLTVPSTLVPRQTRTKVARNLMNVD
jgi:hypothetical protein